MTQPEMLRYIDHVADRFDLLRDITFNVRVTSAVYNESTKHWIVTTSRGDIVEVPFVHSAEADEAPKQLGGVGVLRLPGDHDDTLDDPGE